MYPLTSGVTDGGGRAGGQMPTLKAQMWAPFQKWAPLIRLPLLPKQFYKLQTFSLCKFCSNVLQSFTQVFFKWYWYCQDC